MLYGYPEIPSYTLGRMEFSPSNPFVNQDILFNFSQTFSTIPLQVGYWDLDYGNGDLSAGGTFNETYYAYNTSGTYRVTLTIFSSAKVIVGYVFNYLTVSDISVPEDYSFYFAIAFILLAVGFLIGLLLGKG